MEVAPGAELSVSISASNYGSFGQLTETLPPGFVYVSSSLAADDVEQNGQTVTFTLLGEESFGYKVTATGDVGSYTFQGVLSNSDRVEVPVGGDAEVSVEQAAPTHSASRSFSPVPVDPDAELTVTITAAGYGAFGQVVETLPAGFSYVSIPRCWASDRASLMSSRAT